MSPSAAGFARQAHVRPAEWLAILLLIVGTAGAGIGLIQSGAIAAPAARDSVERPTVVPPSTSLHRVIAYYFHTTFRCVTCRTIEAYSRESIEQAFANELKDGRLVWRVVNIEVKGNEHYVKDYKLYTKSLVLVNEVRGKRAEWKNLEKVWQLLRDKEAFFRYVQSETRAYLGTPASS